jgi:hypothetical protein
MTWIRENKFLAGFFGFILVAAAGLGFLIYQAYGHFGEVDDNYKQQIEKLNGLQSAVPYPDQGNLNKAKEQQTAYVGNIKNLLQDVAAVQFQMEPLTPEAFQDNLRATVNSVTAKAAPKQLPDKFGLGFERYLTETPRKEAASTLGRELKAVEFIVNELIDSKVESITSVIRPPLPEENGTITPKGKLPLVTKEEFDVTFICEQGRFRKILNELVDTKKQFYIIRLLRVKNQALTSPSKNPTGAAAAATPAPGSKDAGGLHYILGTEKLEVTLKLEIVDFNPPTQK